MNELAWLRRIGFAEGVSLLLLLFVAMPLKYIWDQPEAVKIIGWMHGSLFVLFIILALYTFKRRNWSLKKLAIAFVAAFVPFGTFVFDRRLKKEQADV